MVTDGPYAETQEVLAGYWIVECDSFDRATEIAAKLAACPAPERVAATAVADVRPIMDRPTTWPDTGIRSALIMPDATAEDLLRELAPQVLGAVVRRYGHFDTAEDAVQEALLAAARSGRATGSRTTRGLADHRRRAAG